MCGICGKYYFQVDELVDREILMRMTKSLYSRGPDEEGFFINNNIGIGVRRLSIIDKKHGHQPMFNEDKMICNVFNGEIYNYKELRRYLLDKGHILFTDCDSEVISHMYEEFGVFFVEKLHGMFSIALLDLRTRSLMLVRDRIGIKPLYFIKLNDSLVFSSSLNSLIQDNNISIDLDSAGINCYFSYNYFPEDITPLKNIKKLLPGSYLICDSNGIKTNQYWQLDYNNNTVRPENHYINEFKSIFQKVVKAHLISDIPVGIFLSGGLDSSSLTCFASKFRNNLDTFTIGFKEITYDERKYASLVANSLGTRHHEVIIDDDLPLLLEKIITMLDVPMGEPSLLPTFKLSEFAKEYSGVILSGEGVDELFGGYETYKADILAKFFINLPPTLRQRLLPQLVRKLPLNYKRLNFRFKAELFLEGINKNNRIYHYSWREIFSEEEKRMLYSGDFFNHLTKMNYLEEPYEIFKKYFYASTSHSYLERAMFFDTKVWLPNSVLHRVDMASMHNSLEVRVPFLDDELVEFAFRLPLDKKINNMRGKYLLRKAFNDELPKMILNRPKYGFSVPINKWLRYELKKTCLELISNIPRDLEEFLNRNYLLSIFKEHIEGHQDYGRKLWNIIVFILWYNALASRKNISLGR